MSNPSIEEKLLGELKRNYLMGKYDRAHIIAKALWLCSNKRQLDVLKKHVADVVDTGHKGLLMGLAISKLMHRFNLNRIKMQDIVLKTI